MTEPSHLAAVRESYDTVAAAYFERVMSPAELDPVSRATLAAFAELVRTSRLGPVADLGCGPGRVTAHLHGLGLSAFGVDLSPEMVGLARRVHPELRFEEGSMTALDIETAALGGILAWYSTHHTPPDQLPLVFDEFHRILVPGGHLLLGGHFGDGHTRPTHAYGLPVSFESHFLPLDRVAALLGEAGLEVTARVEQTPDEGAKRQHACLLARKPRRA